ncbi:hypothetical protein [Marinimicrobium locisalis]|uniref:hypothetical protein n=1 Tax=Marinimicrobium locisalis TaxID=546022 RepID=UPI0032214AF7
MRAMKLDLPVILFFVMAVSSAHGYSRTEIGLQYRHFFHSPPVTAGTSLTESYELRGEWEKTSEHGPWSLDANLFVSLNSEDTERTYLDAREARLSYDFDDWRFSAGMGTFFWGVSETINVANQLNQSDLREGVDGKVKMGQPFVSINHSFAQARFSMFYLPVFVERVFPERPALPLKVTSQGAFEEDPDGDVAVRLEWFLEDAEVGLSLFRGTRRDPLLRPFVSEGGETRLQPFYPQSDSLSVDVVTFWQSWILKGELQAGEELNRGYTATNIGVEYPFYPQVANVQQVSVVAEHLTDDRDEQAASIGQNDLFVGFKADWGTLGENKLRWVAGYDLEYGSRYWDVSLESRLTDFYRAHCQVVIFSKVDRRDSRLHPVETEDYIELGLTLAF